MHFPTWVDLKGEDSVPETVHHVVVRVDPQQDLSWERLTKHVQTDGVHQADGVGPGKRSAGQCLKLFSTMTATVNGTTFAAHFTLNPTVLIQFVINCN